MEDVKFHQCVRLSRFENDRTISFIPPDGEFELMSYRLSTPVKPLIWAEASIDVHKNSRIEYVVKVKAQFKRRSTANAVEIYVPVPDDASNPRFRAGVGSVVYAPDKSAFVWKIKQLAGAREFLMKAHFALPSVRSGESDFVFGRASMLTVMKKLNQQSAGRQFWSNLRFRISLLAAYKYGTSKSLRRADTLRYHGSATSRNTVTTTGECRADVFTILQTLISSLNFSLRTALEKGSAPIVPM